VDHAARALLALDIDGTMIVPSSGAGTDIRFSDGVSDAIARIAATGAEVALVTARELYAARLVFETLGIERGWIASSKGAVVARIDPALPAGHHVLGTQQFDPRPAVVAIEELDPAVLIAIERPGLGYAVNMQWPAGVLVSPQREWDVVPATATSLMARSHELPREQILEAVSASPAFAEAYGPEGTTWLDLTPAGASKATGAEAIRIATGVDSGQTWAVGDYVKNAALHTWAAHGVAMGQALESTKAAPNQVAGRIDAGGLLSVLGDLARLRELAGGTSY